MHVKTSPFFEFGDNFLFHEVFMVFRTSFKSAKLGHVLSTKRTFQICTPQQFFRNNLFLELLEKNHRQKNGLFFMTFAYYFCKINIGRYLVWRATLETNLKIHRNLI